MFVFTDCLKRSVNLFRFCHLNISWLNTCCICYDHWRTLKIWITGNCKPWCPPIFAECGQTSVELALLHASQQTLNHMLETVCQHWATAHQTIDYEHGVWMSVQLLGILISAPPRTETITFPPFLLPLFFSSFSFPLLFLNLGQTKSKKPRGTQVLWPPSAGIISKRSRRIYAIPWVEDSSLSS